MLSIRSYEFIGQKSLTLVHDQNGYEANGAPIEGAWIIHWGASCIWHLAFNFKTNWENVYPIIGYFIMPKLGGMHGKHQGTSWDTQDMGLMNFSWFPFWALQSTWLPHFAFSLMILSILTKICGYLHTQHFDLL